MKHLDEGTITALRDGALVLADARTHVHECLLCAEALSAAEARADTVARALGLVSEPVDVESAKARVRARLDGRRGSEVAPRRALWPLGRAAALLLVGAGAAWAMPGSPVRDWLRPEATTAAHGSATTAPVAVEGAPMDGGIEVGLRSGRIAISLEGVSDDALVTITWVDEPVARISGPAGSSYGFAEGRAEASVTAGPVEIEISRAAQSVVLEVNQRTILEGPASDPRISGEVVSRTSDRIVFAQTAR